MGYDRNSNRFDKSITVSDDPSAIGPAMALALITTFYGSVLANFICTPIATSWSFRVRKKYRKKNDYRRNFVYTIR